MPIFSSNELVRRQSSFIKGMVEQNLDAALFTTTDAIYYISGVPLLSPWGRPTLALLCADGDGVIVGSNIEKDSMENNTNLSKVLSYGDDYDVHSSALTLAFDFLKSKKKLNHRIGIEKDQISLDYYQRLKTAFPDADYIDISHLIYQLRIIKSEEELAILRLAGTVAKIGANAFLESLQVNATELSVCAYAVSEMNKALAAIYPQELSPVGAATSSYAYCHSGPLHTMTPHAHPPGKRIKDNEIIALNVFPVIWGYCSELERTFILGEPDGERLKALSAINEATDECKKALKPGAVASDIDQLAVQILTGKHGFCKDYIRHGTGHSMGIMIGASGREDLGELRSYNKKRIFPDMVISIEPALYIPGLGGFRHSDVMEVTESGSICQTLFPIDLNSHQ